MLDWKKKIISEFIEHYFDSAFESEEERSVLRIRSSVFFPNFDTSSPYEKESYLETAESLQRKGIVKLNWEKHDKNERLKTLSCENYKKLFEEAGRPYPKTEAENIRTMLGEIVQVLKKSMLPDRDTVQTEKVISLLEFLSLRFGPREIGQGIDQHTMEEFTHLLEFCCGPANQEKITTRALSILLYRDSKRLESLLVLCIPLLSRIKKKTEVPDLSFLERSYPETMIAGKIFFIFKEKCKKDNKTHSFINDNAFLFGFPLETVEMIDSIGYMSGKDKSYVLTIENKETFYALARPQNSGTSELLSMFDCFLYVGGYSNRATAAMIKILAVSNFNFYHTGDLDPDGILILQHIQELAGRPVTPLRMNAATFDQYQDWARPLSKPMLRQITKIRDETKANPELAGLLRRIEETRLGVEQEIIDYR